MREIEGSTEIEAPADRVWSTVTDFASYPEWNPWLTEMSGELEVGTSFGATVRSPGKPALKLTTTVVRVDDGKELLFNGTAMRGLVTDDHRFTVRLLETGRTRFSQRLALRGLMIPFAGGTVQALQLGLEAMNVALKKRCEDHEVG